VNVTDALRRFRIGRSWTVADRAAGGALADEGRTATPAPTVANLVPVVLSGGGRTGSTAIMSMLGTDPRVAFDREYPFESRYLLYFVKFALLCRRPDLFQFLTPEQLFDFDYIGFGGPLPSNYAFNGNAENSLPQLPLDEFVKELWALFSKHVSRAHPEFEFHAEKAPSWLSPIVRQFMPCYTIYNVRDPRDIFISANAFMKKRNYMGFARVAEDTDVDHARHIALAFINTFENYYADRKRDDSMLLRYEDFVLRRDKVAKELHRLCGIVPKTKSGFEFFSIHRTAKDLEHSVDRWKSDPIPEQVVLFLERSLRDEMRELGYTISQPRQHPCPAVSFRNGDMDLSSLACSSDGSLETAGEYATVKIRGVDFWIILPLESFEASQTKEVWVSVQGEIGDVFSLYWHGPNSEFAEQRCMTQSYTPSAHWTVLSFPVYRHPEWQGKIVKLRLDLFNAVRGPHNGSGKIRWMRLIG